MKSEPNRLNGTVKFFKSENGWGFLIGEDNKEYFVHYTSINMPGHKNLVANQKVNFLPESGEKGLSAQFVSIEP